MNTNEMTNSELIAVLAGQIEAFGATLEVLDEAVDAILDSFDDE